MLMKKIDSQNINMAEFVLRYNKYEKQEGDTVDHVKQNHKDCRVQNLRFANASLQNQNKKKKIGAKCDYIGVKAVGKNFLGSLKFKNITYKQRFPTELQAANHYNILAQHFYDKPMLNVLPLSFDSHQFPLSSFATSFVSKPKINSVSKFRGVYFRCNKWYTRIVVQRKVAGFKYFATEKEAAVHYNYLAKLHQKHPKLNVFFDDDVQK